MNTISPMTPATSGRGINTVSWGLRILAAAAFLGAGGAKLAGAPMMVDIFQQIGAGQWFRVLTGVVEVFGAVAILVTKTAAFGGLLLAITMVFAALTHLFIIGGSTVPALTLLLVTAIVAWLHRASFASVFRRLSRA